MSEKRYPPIHKALKKYYGYDSFRPGQEKLIHALLDGRDVFGIMPTGAGKSVCYQIPAIFMKGITLVISPLISLMKDQVAALNAAHIPAAYLNSSLNINQYRKALYFASQGKYKIIYVAPERLNTPGFLDFVSKVEISMIAVDEAHCVSQWGQNFRPSYLEIAQFAKSLPKRPIIAAFTATATGPVKDDIQKLLELENPEMMITGFDRPNLYFEVRQTRDKFSELENFLAQHRYESGIVYCLTRKDVEEVCRKLCDQGFPATAYHAGLPEAQRSNAQDDFQFDRVGIIICTNAFGMGIDKSNVRYVVHYSMPSSLENYYQEAGRAGRDGAPAQCVLLFSPADIHTNQFLIEHSCEENQSGEEQLLREMARLKAMVSYCKTPMCLRSTILQYFGESSSGSCGNCSNCQSEWIEEDVSSQASHIHEGLESLPHAYGMNLLIDFFKGRDLKRLRELNASKLKGYGSLKSQSPDQIRMILDSLLMQGYLGRSSDRYQTVFETPKLAEAIENEEKILVRRKKTKSDHHHAPTTSQKRSDVPKLFKKLREVRLALARKNSLPPYLIVSDASLMALIEARPETKEDLLQVSGFGQVKVERYGQAFLDALHEA